MSHTEARSDTTGEPTTRPSLDPETRRRPTTRGRPVVLGDGQKWLLPAAGLDPAVAALRDALWDDRCLDGVVQVLDVQTAAIVLLTSNYLLSAEEVTELVCSADNKVLCDAVLAALHGEGRDARRTWSSWAVAVLLENRIDPATVPPENLHGLLYYLEIAGKVSVPLEVYSDAAAAAGERSRLLATMAGRGAAEQ